MPITIVAISMTSTPMPSQALYSLILDQAIASIECSKAERAQFRQQFDHYLQQPRLQQEGMTSEQLEAWLDRELKIRKFQRYQWGRTLSSHFLRRKSDLDRVVYSLIYLHDSQLAQELYFRIVEAEQSFEEVTRLYSQKPDAEGRVGPIELGKLHPQLVRLFHGARPGQLWLPTAVGEWTVIARLEAFLPVQLDAATEQILLNELLENWLQQQIKQRFPA